MRAGLLPWTWSRFGRPRCTGADRLRASGGSEATRLNRAIQDAIYRRDHFTCRYCGGLLIPKPIKELIGGLYLDLFPFHRNWRGGETHPAILSREESAAKIANSRLLEAGRRNSEGGS